MKKVQPITALHAMGLSLHEIAEQTIYKGRTGIPFDLAKKWFNTPAKKAKPQIQAMFRAACRILKKEGRIK